MIPLKATIHKSIPMGIGGITHFEIDLHEGVPTCFIGENGSGKSFFQRELTPEPSLSTAYHKGGYKEILWTHNGKTITTRSDFSDGNKHYFIVDGVNLNEGYTSKTQYELCKEYFDLDGAIQMLSHGVVDICNMGPAMRRQFYLSLYPSDLTFVEQAHKNVMRRIREAKAVRTDLLQRIASIEESALSEEEIAILKGNLEMQREALSRVTSNLSVVDAKLAELPKHSAVILTEYPEQCAAIRKMQKELHERTFGSDEMRSSVLSNEIEKFTKQLGECMGTLHGLNAREHQIEEELHELGAQLATSTNWDLADLEEKLDKLMEERKELFVTPADVENLREELLHLNVHRLFDYVHHAEEYMLEDHVLGQEYQVVKGEFEKLKGNIFSTSNSISTKQETVEGFSRQISALGNNACVEGCPTRAKHEEQVAELNRHREQAIHELAELEKRQQHLSTKREEYAELLDASDRVRDALVHIHEVFGTCYPDEEFGTSREFITSLAKRIESDSRKLKEAHRIQALETSIESLQEKIQAVKAASGNVEEMVARKERLEKEMQVSLEAIEANTQTSETLTQQIEANKEIIDLRAELVRALRTGADMAKDFCEYNERDRVSEMRNYLSYVQSTVAQEAQRLQDRFEESQKVTIRLEEELRPALERVESNLLELMEVEYEVSPKTGVTRDSLSEFINLIFARTNDILLSLVSYPMELDLLDMDAELDFKFSAKLQENSTPIPEIKLFSTGQGNLFNFAHYLACIDVRGLAQDYPVKIDEIDATWSKGHKESLVATIADLRETSDVSKLVIVNHHNSFYEGIKDLQICCLDESGIVLPRDYNDGVTIERS